MAKYDFEILAAFAPQTGEGAGEYDSTLDGITTAIYGDPDTTDDGLVLGDPEAGIGESGISFGFGRRHRDKAVLAGGDTRPLSDWLAAEVRTFSFTFPFCGNRATTTAGTPVDGDFQPLRGVEAILNGAGLLGAAWGTGVGWSFKFGTVWPFSSLLWFGENRLELLDCRCNTLAITYTPGALAIATADIVVGSIKDPAAKGFSPVTFPTTVDYGPQAEVSAPVVEQIGHAWQETRGFSELTINISRDIGDVLDSNAIDGIIKAPSGKTVTIEAVLYSDTVDKVYELDQAFATVVGDLDALAFQVGTDAAASSPALAHSVNFPQPELDEGEPDKLGDYQASSVNLIARHATVNEEMELIFR